MVNAQLIAMSGQLTISSSGRFAAIRPVTGVDSHSGTAPEFNREFAGARRAGARAQAEPQVASGADAATDLLSDRGQQLARLRVMAQLLGQEVATSQVSTGGNYPSSSSSARIVRKYQMAAKPFCAPVAQLNL